MTATGGKGKDSEKDQRAASKPSMSASEGDDQKPQKPAPPSESDRASAAKSNPLRGAAGETGDGGKTSKPAGGKKGAPELRISASMLSTQPPANANTRPEEPIEPLEPMHPTTGKARHRRRVRSLARPIEPEVVKPFRLVWPRANSRSAARIASRYGFVGFILALVWAMLEVRIDTVSQALNVPSTATAAAVVIGTIAVIALTVVGYWYHSRLAALLALAGVITLVVVEHQGQHVAAIAIAGQAVVIYLLMHGVHGTIAYHIFGKSKRRRRSGYRYRSY